MSHRIGRTAPARTVAALAVALALLTACGDDEPGSDTAAPTTSESAATSSSAAPTSTPAATSAAAEVQTITATEVEFSITPDRDSLPAGAYEIQVVNNGTTAHDLTVERDGQAVAASDMIAPGQTGTVTVTLEPGQYVFYCSIGRHRALGMETTAQVT